MEFVTIKDKAIEWSLSEKRVQVLCAEDRVIGAQKVGNSWIIPINARKPMDNRIKNNDEIINMHDISAIIELLGEDKRITEEYLVRVKTEKEAQLNPLFNLKKIYSVMLIVDKYYCLDLLKYIGNQVTDVEKYINNINSKIVVTKMEELTEINELILVLCDMTKNILELILNQSQNNGIVSKEFQVKYNKEYERIFLDFIRIVVQYHGTEIVELFNEFMSICNEDIEEVKGDGVNV